MWGHDKTRLPDDQLPYVKGDPVTEAAYRAYLAMRGADGKGPGGMQGVGGLQLTWWELQDEADREGGCWLPRPNTRVGCRHMVRQLRRGDLRDSLARYNTGQPYRAPEPGKGPNYADRTLPIVDWWRRIIDRAGSAA